ncbi:hypothetical protein QYE76_066072 [Lolium multiflorum]|uniref:DUF295 domain-containing protein n=1 Tax=Lolium multiflorum TaxID=4521 RepID=A0AAD8SC10_LOLMU|nr:hypothetical protein QYE76_066072 [Lolium multiflorum]
MAPLTKGASRHRRPWSKLPHDLLSVILDRLGPAFVDRVRFRGVCQGWRGAELAHPRPPMSWLVAPGHFVSFHDAAIHRVLLPEDAAGAVCRGSFGDWLALVPPTGRRRPYLLNAFTMERIKLPRWKDQSMVKLVLSSAPDSKSCTCTVAAIVEHEDDYYRMRSKIVVCRVGRGGSWRTMTRAFELQDIIFFERKLHALDAKARVHVFQDEDFRRDEPWRPPEGQIGIHVDMLHLVVLHGSLLMVGRDFGRSRVPGCTHFTSAVGVFTLDLGGETETAKRPEPVKDLVGHAIFVGDACCDAFAVGASSSGGGGRGGGKIRENQICFVDDEKNMSMSSLAAYDRRSFRQLQSYDVRNDCLRTYEPSPAGVPGPGTWRVGTVQRFPHTTAMGPPVRTALLSAAELVLWDLINCLGASYGPNYYTTMVAGGSSVTVCISLPKTAATRKYDDWNFTQHRPSAREAKQAAAHEAATFLRSRFRSVLDDSPWSSIPYYHSHVEEKEDDNDEEEEAPPDPESNLNFFDLFDYKRWYRG